MSALSIENPSAYSKTPYFLERNGLTIFAVQTSSLSSKDLVAILTFRLNQYASDDSLVNQEALNRSGLSHEPFSAVSERDVHLVAVSSETRTIHCYLTLRRLTVPDQWTLLSHGRPLLKIEERFGQGVLNGVTDLNSLFLNRIVEAARFVKDAAAVEYTLLAPLEILVAACRVVTAIGVEAIIGDAEDSGGLANLRFFRIPHVVLRDVKQLPTDGDYIFRPEPFRVFQPFYILVSELASSTERLNTIDTLLNLPMPASSAALLSLLEQDEPYEGK